MDVRQPEGCVKRLRLTSETQLSKELCPSSKKHCVCCLVRRMLLANLNVVMPTLSANLYKDMTARREIGKSVDKTGIFAATPP